MRCWAPSGDEIELCGHGLLCCAHAWLVEESARESLAMNGTRVHFESRGGLGWLAFPSIETQPCETPLWSTKLLQATPERAAIAGPENGYLVLEMPADCDLTALQAPGDLLTAKSTRSLIVTRRVSSADSLQGETLHYRYFAPQFGVPEDTATGSAMRVLATYWQQRGAGDEQRALQRSPGGGWLESRIDDPYTWIGGRVSGEGTA